MAINTPTEYLERAHHWINAAEDDNNADPTLALRMAWGHIAMAYVVAITGQMED